MCCSYGLFITAKIRLKTLEKDIPDNSNYGQNGEMKLIFGSRFKLELYKLFCSVVGATPPAPCFEKWSKYV